MTISPIHASARLFLPPTLAALAAIASLAGCATSEPQRPAQENRAAENKPATPPASRVQPITNFSSSVRCMDTLLLDYGTRDITVLVEDLADQSKGAGAAVNAKDTLIAVVSDMTQRSRAIRVVASGRDWGNTVNAMSALKREQFAVAPQYALRGTLTLLDNQNVQRNAENTAASVLGIDLTMLTTQDMSIVPGTATRNSVVLFKQGRAFDGKAEIRKFGQHFGISTSSSEVVGQASRALVEMATIELFGRLARVPYWTCLGMTEAQDGVAAEIQDWYDSMAVTPVEIIKYFQSQLRLRRVYDGPIDGAANAQLKEAVAVYREALGLSREPKLSLDFFKAYLAANHHDLQAKLAPIAPAPEAVAVAVPAPAPLAAPVYIPQPVTAAPVAPIATAAPRPAARPQLALSIASGNETHRFAPGEKVQLTIRPSRSAHVYCFLQDEQRKIKRFFPNRFQRDSRVQDVEGLQLPGQMGFELAMNPNGRQETVACFATDRDVLAQLPASVNVGDFAALPIASLDQLRNEFARAANGALAQQTYLFQPR